MEKEKVRSRRKLSVILLTKVSCALNPSPTTDWPDPHQLHQIYGYISVTTGNY